MIEPGLLRKMRKILLLIVSRQHLCVGLYLGNLSKPYIKFWIRIFRSIRVEKMGIDLQAIEIIKPMDTTVSTEKDNILLY